jgi:hypothetical protein
MSYFAENKWAVSSAVEHCFHTAGVTGSIPVPPTNIKIGISVSFTATPKSPARGPKRTFRMEKRIPGAAINRRVPPHARGRPKRGVRGVRPWSTSSASQRFCGLPRTPQKAHPVRAGVIQLEPVSQCPEWLTARKVVSTQPKKSSVIMMFCAARHVNCRCRAVADLDGGRPLGPEFDRLWLDMKIIARTVLTLGCARNAY